MPVCSPLQGVYLPLPCCALRTTLRLWGCPAVSGPASPGCLPSCSPARAQACWVGWSAAPGSSGPHCIFSHSVSLDTALTHPVFSAAVSGKNQAIKFELPAFSHFTDEEIEAHFSECYLSYISLPGRTCQAGGTVTAGCLFTVYFTISIVIKISFFYLVVYF